MMNGHDDTALVERLREAASWLAGADPDKDRVVSKAESKQWSNDILAALSLPARREGVSKDASFLKQLVDAQVKREGSFSSFMVRAGLLQDILATPSPVADDAVEREDEDRRDAWSDFESEHLQSPNGDSWRDAAVCRACREAFDEAYAGGSKVATRAALAALSGLGEQPTRADNAPVAAASKGE
uniref:hypothetical protein n=1 Tax=uncultured Sphingomonas sp. TaxID=158754 RepID=UPI0035CB4FB1